MSWHRTQIRPIRIVTWVVFSSKLERSRNFSDDDAGKIWVCNFGGIGPSLERISMKRWDCHGQRSRDQRERKRAHEWWGADWVPVLVLQFQSPGNPRVRWPQKCPLIDQASLSCFCHLQPSLVQYSPSFFFFFPIAYSQLKTVRDPEMSSFDFSEMCRIATKLMDLMATSFRARMYSGLLRTAVADAYCPRVIFASVPFQ